jgi:hypothetical protein
MKRWLIQLSRTLGRCVCAVRGHRYFYPGGCWNSWSAYTCVRCGALSRDLDSLDFVPDDEPFIGFEDEDDIALELSVERRWITRLPFPRWL